MNFWRALAWTATLVFIGLLAYAWVDRPTHIHSPAQQSGDPPPAPTFR